MVFAAIRAQRGIFRLADLERACPRVGREWIREVLGRFERFWQGRLPRQRASRSLAREQRLIFEGLA